MRRLAKLLPYVAIIVIVIAAVAYWYLTGPFQQRLRSVFIREVEARTGLKVGVRSLRITSGRVTLRDVVLTQPDGTRLATVPEIIVLLGQGRFPRTLAELQQIREVDIHRPSARIVREKTGTFNIEQLLKPRKGAPRFTGRIKADDGTIEYVDDTRGGATTALQHLRLDYAVAADGTATFSVAATGERQSFASLQASGTRHPTSGTDVTGTIRDADLPYAMRRLPPVRGVTVTAGRADVTARAAFGRTPQGTAQVSWDVRITPRGATVSFPWLKRPLTSIAGEVRVVNRDLRLTRITGKLMGVPVTANGTAVGLPKPHLNLTFAVAGIDMPRIRALMPTLTLPSTLSVNAPAHVTATATGVSPNLTVRGRAAVGEATFACIPWHDVVADFAWTRGQVTITGLRAHGSPRHLEGNIDVRTTPGQRQTRAQLVMRDVPLQVLRQCTPSLKTIDLSGVATISVNAQLGAGTQVSGHFAARSVGYQHFRLGEVSGDFTMAGQQVVQFTNGRIAGPTATGDFAGTATRTGDFTVDAQLRALDLAALGAAGLTGTARGPLHATGSARAGTFGGHFDFTLTNVLKGAVRAAAADFQVARNQVALTHLVAQPRTGRATGSLAFTNLSQGKQARVSGQLEVTDVSASDWLPPNVIALVPRARATGTVTLGGRLGSPRVQADLRLQGMEVPQVGAGEARLRVTYEAGNVAVQEFAFEGPQGRIVAQGGYTRLRGLDLSIPEARADLSVLSPYLQAATGLRVSGPAVISATAKGRPENPEVTFSLRADRAEIATKEKAGGALSVQNVAVIGRVHDQVLTLEQAGFDHDGGSVSLTGTYGLRTMRMDLRLVATAMDLATLASPWLREHTGLDAAGRMSVSVTAAGTVLSPVVTFDLTSPTVTVNEQDFHDLKLAGQLRGLILSLQPLSFKQNGGEVTLDGTVNFLTREVSLTPDLTDLSIYNFTLIFARAAARLNYSFTKDPLRGTDRLLAFYNKIPGPFTGTLSLHKASVTGTYDNPRAQAHLAVENLAYDGRKLDHLDSDFTIEAAQGRLRRIEIKALNAVQGTEGSPEAASASVSGSVVIGGPTELTGNVNNLGLQLLQPWLRGVQGLRGQATINFDVSGQTANPLIIGSIAVKDFDWGGLRLDNALFFPIRVQQRVATIEDIMLQRGPMQGTGQASFLLPPLGEPWTAGRILATAEADLQLRGGELTLVGGTTPAQPNAAPAPPSQAGQQEPEKVPAQVFVDVADFHLRGRHVILAASPGPAPGPDIPGVRGHMGRGAFSVGGEVLLPEEPTMENLPYSLANLQVLLDPCDLNFPNFITAQLRGRLVLGNDPKDGRMRLATLPGEPLQLANGTVTVPPMNRPLTFAAALPVAPSLAIRVAAGESLRFTYASVARINARIDRADFAVTGQLNAQQVQLHGTAESRQGRLDFPNGRLDLVHARVSVDRDAEQPLTVRVDDSEAAGQVGDYQVVLNPRGQVYPLVSTESEAIPFDLNARSTPFLDTPYIMALLVGPVISPSATGVGLEPLDVLAASRPQVATAGTITGVSLPSFVGQNLALDYSFEGPLSLRLRERLAGRLFGQYVSPLTGPAETRRLVLTYQVTPRYSFGFSENGLGQSRWQIQSFFSF